MRFVSNNSELFLKLANDYVIKIGKHYVVPKRKKTYVSFSYKITEEEKERYAFRIKGSNKLLTDQNMIKAFQKVKYIEIPIEYNDIEILLEDQRLLIVK